jgi:hypothetical protein
MSAARAAAGRWPPGVPARARRGWPWRLGAWAAAFLLARHLLVPHWAARVQAGQARPEQALDAVLYGCVGLALATFGVAWLAGRFIVLVRGERYRRGSAAARELEFMASLGHRHHSLSQPNDPSRPR